MNILNNYQKVKKKKKISSGHVKIIAIHDLLLSKTIHKHHHTNSFTFTVLQYTISLPCDTTSNVAI